MSQPGVQRAVQCYHCRHRFEVGPKVQSTSCPKCSKQLRLEDVVVKTLEAVRKIQTCGKVVVEKKGRIIAQLVEAHAGVFVEGSMEANVVSGGPVKLGPKAHWKGDLSGPSVEVKDGCVIVGGYFTIPDDKLGLLEVKPAPVAAAAAGAVGAVAPTSAPPSAPAPAAATTTARGQATPPAPGGAPR